MRTTLCLNLVAADSSTSWTRISTLRLQFWIALIWILSVIFLASHLLLLMIGIRPEFRLTIITHYMTISIHVSFERIIALVGIMLYHRILCTSPVVHGMRYIDLLISSVVFHSYLTSNLNLLLLLLQLFLNLMIVLLPSYYSICVIIPTWCIVLMLLYVLFLYSYVLSGQISALYT